MDAENSDGADPAPLNPSTPNPVRVEGDQVPLFGESEMQPASAGRAGRLHAAVQTGVALAAEADARALMALFYFRRVLDHQAISLCVAHFRPLDRFFLSSAAELRAFFAEHRHMRGVVDAAQLASPSQRAAARRYADQRLPSPTPPGRGEPPGALLTASHPRFPHSLSRSRLPVDWLFCYPTGLPFPLARPVVAVIGSRESSAAQLAAAAVVAEAVGLARGTVVTGLATGADAAAHAAAVDTEASSVAVLGGGVRKVYPAEHTRWVRELVAGRGTVLTETPPDGAANADAFVLRNRIVAGLADVVVAVSGKYASGTSHTVRFAADMGVRTVSVDPSPESGITRLIRELGGEALTLDDLASSLEREAGSL